MRDHPVAGERISGRLRSTQAALGILRRHHERVDGGGYPDHLVGDGIPLPTRIAAVADAWDAIVSDRPYRDGLDADEALRWSRDGAGTQWDAELVATYRELVERGAIVRLTRSAPAVRSA